MAMIKTKETAIKHLRAKKPFYYVVFDAFRDDDEVVMEAIKNDQYFSLSVVSERLKNNFEVVLAAVKCRNYSLKFASANMRDNEEIVSASVTRSGSSLEYASERLRSNKELILIALATDKTALRYVPFYLRADKKFILEMLKSCPFDTVYFYASKEIKEIFRDTIMRNTNTDPIKTLEAVILAEKLNKELQAKGENRNLPFKA